MVIHYANSLEILAGLVELWLVWTGAPEMLYRGSALVELM